MNRLFENVDPSWVDLLHSLAYQEPLVTFLSSLSEVSHQPGISEIFKVFEMPVSDIKVVILGPEPYPIPGIASGLAYASKDGKQGTDVLNNIVKEISLTEGVEINQDIENYNTLEHLHKQGVFLLNASLTTLTGEQGSHKRYWKEFIRSVIRYISEKNPCIWMVWGANASVTALEPRVILNPLLVQGYDRESIEMLPADTEVNYIVPGQHPGLEGFSEDGFYFVNKILENNRLKLITW
jgi:uracil-DNA glycosylase